jgi:hypothetical protein
MGKPKSKTSAFAKVTIFFALALLVGVGLCGLDFALGANGIGKAGGEFSVGPLDGVSLITMFLSAIGLVIATIVWVVAAAIRSFSRDDSEPPRLLDEKDDEQKQRRDGPLD